MGRLLLLLILASCATHAGVATTPSPPRSSRPTSASAHLFDIEHRNSTTTWATIVRDRLAECRRGVARSCHLLGQRHLTPDVAEVEHELCANGDVYACRTLSYKHKRVSEAADCENGTNPNMCLEWSMSSHLAGRVVLDMYRDGCRRGVLWDCAIVVVTPEPIPRAERRDAMILRCHYAGDCDGIAQVMRMHKDLDGARYYLQVACHLHERCAGLAAVYREGLVRELWRGHFVQVRTRACRWEDNCEARLNEEIATLRKPPDDY